MVKETPKPSPRTARLLLAAGFLVYVAVQGYLTVSPLQDWTLTPEAKDGLTYVLKSRQMAECFTQDCLALNDLRQQLYTPAADPVAAREQGLAASKVFPIYHPLFSALLLGLTGLGISLMEAYRLLWSLAPVIFGLAFAYWLTRTVGPAPAGLALMLLAFKVFPDTGLHHLVPSNLTMALAVVLWGRIIARQGAAPWSLFLGSLALITMHPIGVFYSLMGGALALSLASPKGRRPLWWAALGVVGAVGAMVLTAYLWKGPGLVTFALLPQTDHPFRDWLAGVGQNLLHFGIGVIRLEEGLFGAPPIFLGAAVLGLGTLAASSRRVVWRLLLIYGLVLGGLFFYISSHPADVLLRLWIPLVVLLFGLVGQALRFSLDLTLAWWRQGRLRGKGGGGLEVKNFWPVVLLVVLLGYAGQMVFRGVEQVQVMAVHLRERQPLALFPAQPAQLLAQARPGDRVLYTSFILMPYYFIHGALRLGAVYYHPSFQDIPALRQWLSRPDVRFAVTYNPTMYHPSFEGLDERTWWSTMPDFRYSALNQRRTQGPGAREGKIPGALYRWLDLRVRTPNFPPTLKLQLENPGEGGVLELVPLNQAGEPVVARRQVIQVPARFSGWLSVDLGTLPVGSGLRLVFPPGRAQYHLGGLTFGGEGLHWPWSHRAQLTFQPRDSATEPFTVSFDPRDLLPPPLKERPITVLDDRGSSVLLQLGP